MNNSIYILSSLNISVEKFHLCTWDVPFGKTFIEVGMSIANTNALPDRVDMFVDLPFISSNCTIISLHETLNDNDNYKFIFNVIPSSIQSLGGEKRNGSIVILSGEGEERERTHLVANATTEIVNNHILKVSFNKGPNTVGHNYVRLLIETKLDTIAEVRSGITKKAFIFDIKINEARNIPSDVLDYKRNNNLNISNVEKAYCLHCVPDNYELSFADFSKMKNIRKLEKEGFQKYLPLQNKLEGEYIIIFIKDSNDSFTYSFFTTFNKEILGNKQILLAVVANLICNLLFAISSFRKDINDQFAWYEQLPIEWFIALGVISICLICCLPIKTWLKKCSHRS